MVVQVINTPLHQSGKYCISPERFVIPKSATEVLAVLADLRDLASIAQLVECSNPNPEVINRAVPHEMSSGQLLHAVINEPRLGQVPARPDTGLYPTDVYPKPPLRTM